MYRFLSRSTHPTPPDREPRMPLRLPPLSALRFFEAAARLCSFKLAAAELNVTPSAVSHGIVALEQSLGVDLFVREPRGLSLTPEGELYLPYVAEAFALIAIGTQRLPDRRAHRTISVSCAPTLASRWLLPALSAFRARWPNLGVSVDTSQRQVAFPVDGFDFAIRLSRGPVAGAAWTRLFGESLVPVGSPAYLDTLRADDGRIDLRRATLIHVDSASEDWPAWLDAAGPAAADGIVTAGGLRFDTIQLAFEAAAMGLGVAIGRRPLADHDLAARVLVEASDRVVAAQTAYWLVCAEGAEDRPDLAVFRQWLLDEARALTRAAPLSA
ncbi:DNA-binding transcriptional LysR family regulator [Paraburkholderia caballeronis]|nr:DNA-binding transcriptional LysR family regulator [Paraburkholderia caballeronis]